LLNVFGVSHRKLVEDNALLPSLEHPHTSRKQFAAFVHISKVWTAQTHIAIHLVFVFIQQGKSCPDDKSSKRMANKSQPSELTAWTALPDVLVYFFSQSFSHLKYIDISVSFICLSTQEQGIWHRDRYVVLQHSHVIRASLEAMTQDKQVHALVIGVELRWVRLLLQEWVLVDFKCVRDPLAAFAPDEALFKDQRGVSLHVLRPSFFLS
jgi:hypothetical protein